MGTPNRYQGRPKGASKKQLYLIWWVLGVAVQILAGLPLVLKAVSWKAVGLTSLVFIPLMMTVESISVYWGWWVWNEDKLCGVKIGLLPLEEVVLYLLVVPSVVVLFHLVGRGLQFIFPSLKPDNGKQGGDG